MIPSLFDHAPKEMDAPELPPSLWAATAEPAPDCPPLRGDDQADVAVVGGGFTGLSTALHLAEKGVAVRVLEAGEPGWGASGRNGGQVIPGLKYDPDELIGRYGPELGPRLVDAVGGAAQGVFDLIARHGIVCDAVQEGWIQPSHCPAAVDLARFRVEQWSGRGAPVEVLDRQQVREMIGSTAYHGGWLDRRGGGLQPLSYARGLARAANALGAGIHGASRVRRLARAGTAWRLETDRGTLSADKVVLATNGYTDGLWPGLARSVIPFYSFIIATEPLPEAVRQTILPGRQVASDSRRLLNYFMVERTGRLLLGGRGPFKDRPSRADAALLIEAVKRTFPQAADVPLAYRWAGRVAMTADHVPHIHNPAPGLYAGLGFNGRGVAMATLLGRFLAQMVMAAKAEDIPFPVTPLKPLPFHRLHRPVVAGLIRYYRLRDRLEERAPARTGGDATVAASDHGNPC